jgi:thiosulfate/3-mercaptopyruvate sulfurtransferase
MKANVFPGWLPLVCATLITATLPAADAPLVAKPSLVSAEWLAQNLKAPSLRIIDARAGLAPYLQSHVPGAVYLNTETLRYSRGGLPGQMLPAKDLARLFGELGIGNRQSVVVYSSTDEGFTHATYIAFLLEYLGHPQVAVLDGGFERWKQENRPVTTEFPSVPPQKFAAKANPAMMVDARRMRQLSESKEAVLLDARKPQQFAAGHIPQAANCYSMTMIQTNAATSWRPATELQKMLADAGANGEKPVVAYCNSGREASQLWFTLRHVLGQTNVTVYPGSWIDWSAQKLPKETNP